MASEYIGNSKRAYDTLENALKNEWIKNDTISANNDNIKDLIVPFANLKYFVGNDGKFLYTIANNAFSGLDYEAILAQNSDLRKSNDNETQKYITNLFMQTNLAWQKLDMLIDGANYSRLHNRFGEKRKIIYNIPEPIIDLRQFGHISNLKPFFEGAYFNNSLSLLETITKNSKECQLIKEKIKDKGDYINSFLTFIQQAAKKKEILGYDLNNELDKKIAKYFSAIDEIDAEECKANRLLGKNRITPQIIGHLAGIIGEQKLLSKDFNKYLSTPIIDWIEKQKKKK
jgi:hypothetical protein